MKIILPFAPLDLCQQNDIDRLTQGAAFGQGDAVIVTVEGVRQNLKAPLKLVMDQITKNWGIIDQRLNRARLDGTQPFHCCLV